MSRRRQDLSAGILQGELRHGANEGRGKEDGWGCDCSARKRPDEVELHAQKSTIRISIRICQFSALAIVYMGLNHPTMVDGGRRSAQGRFRAVIRMVATRVDREVPRVDGASGNHPTREHEREKATDDQQQTRSRRVRLTWLRLAIAGLFESAQSEFTVVRAGTSTRTKLGKEVRTNDNDDQPRPLDRTAARVGPGEVWPEFRRID